MAEVARAEKEVAKRHKGATRALKEASLLEEGVARRRLAVAHDEEEVTRWRQRQLMRAAERSAERHRPDAQIEEQLEAEAKAVLAEARSIELQSEIQFQRTEDAVREQMARQRQADSLIARDWRALASIHTERQRKAARASQEAIQAFKDMQEDFPRWHMAIARETEESSRIHKQRLAEAEDVFARCQATILRSELRLQRWEELMRPNKEDLQETMARQRRIAAFLARDRQELASIAMSGAALEESMALAEKYEARDIALRVTHERLLDDLADISVSEADLIVTKGVAKLIFPDSSLQSGRGLLYNCLLLWLTILLCYCWFCFACIGLPPRSRF